MVTKNGLPKYDDNFGHYKCTICFECHFNAQSLNDLVHSFVRSFSWIYININTAPLPFPSLLNPQNSNKQTKEEKKADYCTYQQSTHKNPSQNDV